MEKERMNELVKQAAKKDSGSPAAFAALYEEVYRGLYKQALYALGNVQDAENACSDAVLDAYQGIGGLREEGAFKAWIFRILTMKIKKRQAQLIAERERLSPGALEEYEGEAAADPAYGRTLDRDQLKPAFAVLSPEERNIVLLRAVGGFESDEIGDLLEINRNTVRSKYARALGKMREALTAE